MPAAPRPAPPVSIRTIAELAGVSAMTVSKALRRLPKVSARTRARITRIAAKIGYKPDPEMAKLMHHLRRRSQTAFQSLICAITDRPAKQAHPYQGELIAGAERRAQDRGYGFTLMSFDENGAHRRQLRRIIWARGVQGVLLLPLREPADLTDLLPWTDLSAVAVTLSLVGPAVHRAIPNHFANTLQICRRLSERGYRRAGLVIDAGQELRVDHAFTAAVIRHNLEGHRVSVAPFVYERLDPAALLKWFRRESPDAIIATDDNFCREYARILGLAIPGPVGFVSTNTFASSRIAGIDELPQEVGATAVDLLAGMIQHGERGLPRHPATTELHGAWVNGVSCPDRRPGAGRRSRGLR
jgi:DNA-binding LacI/PurR family transcriptional regulator